MGKYYLTLALLMVLAGGCFYAEGRVDESPNVILILADDMGLGDVAAFNGGLNRTPVLDSLIEEGVLFNQAYSASCVCAPARAALLTGLYPHRTGDVTLNVQRWPKLTRISKSHETVANLFQNNGYKTALIGKWHSGEGKDYHPLSRGFDEFYGFKGYQVAGYWEYGFEVDGRNATRTDVYLTDLLTEYSIQFVRENKNAPFFLHLSHFAPHRPLEAPKELVDLYRKQGYDENTALVYSMVEVMDRGIGELLVELEELGIRDKTLIIFASDNGPDPLTGTRFNHEFKGQKYSNYEGGIRVPLVFNWRDTIHKGRTDQVAHFIDIVPTLVDLCHLDVSENTKNKLDGRSLEKVIKSGTELNTPTAYFWQWNRGVPYYTHNAAVREGQWKLVRPVINDAVVLPSDGIMRSYDSVKQKELLRHLSGAVGFLPESESTRTPLLYNLKEDPTESIDLSREYPSIYSSLKVKLEDWSREMEFSRNQYRD